MFPLPLQLINSGSNPNDGTGDKLRPASSKINSNFLILSSSLHELSESIDRKLDIVQTGSIVISYTNLSNIPTGIISSSSPLPVGVVSSSAQIVFSGISSKPNSLTGYGILDSIQSSSYNSFTSSYSVDSSSFSNRITNVESTSSTLAFNIGAPNITFADAPQILDLTLTGEANLSASGYAAGREARIHYNCDGTTRAITFPASWRFIGSKPTSIPAGKLGVLSLYSRDGTESGVIAAWGGET